jgi:hypothetical protein
MKGQAHSPAALLLFVMTWRRHGIAGLGLLFTSAAALGQPASMQAPGSYVDRVMDGQPGLDGGLQLKASEYNETGWPRSWHADYALFKQTGNGNSATGALDLGGFMETPNHGALSAHASLSRRGAGASGFRAAAGNSDWRIDQRALPLDGGWFANHNAGNINTTSTRLARGTGRVSIPATPLHGVGGQWYLPDSIDLNAATGSTGLFTGFNSSGFESSAGRITSAGGQFRLPAGMTPGTGGRADAALQLMDGKNIPDGGGFGITQDTRAWFAAASWEGPSPWESGLAAGYGAAHERVGGLRLQANMVQSSGTQSGGATGLWLDAAWRTERWRQAAGVFRFEPNLRWGTTGLAGDLQGLYWQGDTATRQWQAGFAAELSDTVSGSQAGGAASGGSAFVNLNGRYLLDISNTVAAALSFRTITSPGQAVQFSWNRAGDWGQTQWRADLAKASGARTLRLGVDHSWPVLWTALLSTSLALERIHGSANPGSGLVWGVLGTVSPWPQWSVDASLRGTRGNGGESLNANIGVNWQPSGGWSLSLRYTESRGQETPQALVVSALTAATLQPAVNTNTQANRSIQLLLRYQDHAGMATAPLGGLPGTGAGSLAGTVFFDADANGRREASEGGVPGVTVILDRRYVTQTDAQGRYEYPSVAAGEHLVEVSSDNVPLPWSPVLREPVKTRILVRQTHSLDFAVQRER